MSEKNPPAQPPFEIGLVLSGAISAGAYTAGVVDFLILALDEFEAAKKRNDPECPRHDVRLSVMAGASAGGMTAALTAGLLYEDFPHIDNDDDTGSTTNTLFESWVNRIDAKELLGQTDLAKGPVVKSVLDSTIIGEIAAAALDPKRKINRKKREYVADPLDIVLTVTNLRGVPYPVHFGGCDADNVMSLHADRMHFSLHESATPPVGSAIPLKCQDFSTPGWTMFQLAAVATGAFPIGLAPTLLKRDHTFYQDFLPSSVPYWKGGVTPSEPYQFLGVDGGVMDNEPIGLAQEILEKRAGNNNPAGSVANHALLVVEAFPNSGDVGENQAEDVDIFGLGARLATTLLAQVRFKYDALKPAGDPHIFNRFMIAPLRRVGSDRDMPAPHALACGLLNGFGGFLDRSLRAHDYQLGRRNCQRFLRNHFALPADGDNANPLFNGWLDSLKKSDKFIIERKRGSYLKPAPGDSIDTFLPIIPLIGKAAENLKALPPWPQINNDQLACLRKRISARLNAVVNALISRYAKGWMMKRVASNAWWYNRKKVIVTLLGHVKEDLKRRDQWNG